MLLELDSMGVAAANPRKATAAEAENPVQQQEIDALREELAASASLAKEVEELKAALAKAHKDMADAEARLVAATRRTANQDLAHVGPRVGRYRAGTRSTSGRDLVHLVLHMATGSDEGDSVEKEHGNERHRDREIETGSLLQRFEGICRFNVYTPIHRPKHVLYTCPLLHIFTESRSGTMYPPPRQTAMSCNCYLHHRQARTQHTARAMQHPARAKVCVTAIHTAPSLAPTPTVSPPQLAPPVHIES